MCPRAELGLSNASESEGQSLSRAMRVFSAYSAYSQILPRAAPTGSTLPAGRTSSNEMNIRRSPESIYGASTPAGRFGGARAELFYVERAAIATFSSAETRADGRAYRWSTSARRRWSCAAATSLSRLARGARAAHCARGRRDGARAGAAAAPARSMVSVPRSTRRCNCVCSMAWNDRAASTRMSMSSARRRTTSRR